MKVPEIGSIISVYHPREGSVNMTVVDGLRINRIYCEYEGIEYTIKVGSVTMGDNLVLRWEAEDN